MNGYKDRVTSSIEILQEEVKCFPKIEISLPEIPKMLYSLADKIGYGSKSRKSSVQTSSITPLHLKPQQIVTEQYSGDSDSGTDEKQSQMLD